MVMPKMEASDRFQGLCLQSSKGQFYMKNFDRLPPEIRERLRESPFNLCTACVIQQAEMGSFLSSIHRMEAMIRCEEVK